MGNQRILAGAAAILSFTNLDADGALITADDTVTVGVTRADGTVLIAAGTATTHTAGTGVYTKTLTGVQTAALDLLTATWLDTTTSSSRTTLHEIVGGYVFSIPDARAFETLGDTGTYPTANLIATRAEVEDELEQLRDAAFVPRYARLILSGTGDHELVTGRSWLRTLRSVKVLATTGSSTSTAFTAAQLAACEITEDGRIRRGDGDVFTWGVSNIIVEVEHGFTDWGSDLKIAALTRLRERLNRPNSGIPDRAMTYTSLDGDTYQLGVQDVNSTGNPYVDSVYSRYPRPATGPQPASRLLTFQPQFGGVFRGWPVSQ